MKLKSRHTVSLLFLLTVCAEESNKDFGNDFRKNWTNTSNIFRTNGYKDKKNVEVDKMSSPELPVIREVVQRH